MKTLRPFVILLFILNVHIFRAQESRIIEVAPYTTICPNSDEERCLVLLDKLGTELDIMPLNSIEGFTAEEGFEYTLEIVPLENPKGDATFKIVTSISKLWVPQFSSTAPALVGSFRVERINGKRLLPNTKELIINARNSVISGNLDCNNFHLFFKQLGYSLIFSKILATTMSCPGGQFIDQEYLSVFNGIHHFSLDGDVLKLFDISDKELVEAVLIR